MLYFPRWKGRLGWLLDSGSSCDLVQYDSIPDMQTTTTETIKILDTANGVVRTNAAVELDIGTFPQKAQPYVVENSPPLLSLGQRCMSDGFSLYWGPGQLPILTTPQGKHITLNVEVVDTFV